MPVTFDPDCFDPSGPVDPDWDSVGDDFDPAEMTGHSKGGWEADPKFRIITNTVERAADALLVAAQRFMHVGESGREHGDSMSAALEDDCTPNIAFVTVDSEAAYLVADTKGGLSHEMAATMKHILAEELTRVDVAALITSDYNPSRGYGADPWPRPHE